MPPTHIFCTSQTSNFESRHYQILTSLEQSCLHRIAGHISQDSPDGMHITKTAFACLWPGRLANHQSISSLYLRPILTLSKLPISTLERLYSKRNRPVNRKLSQNRDRLYSKQNHQTNQNISGEAMYQLAASSSFHDKNSIGPSNAYSQTTTTA